MIGSKMSIQNTEVIERTNDQRIRDDMFLTTMADLVKRRLDCTDPVHQEGIAALHRLIESDILGIYGAPAYLARLNQLLRAEDLSDDLDEDLGHKMAMFRTTLTHPGVVPYLHSSGMLLTMRLLADQQARYGTPGAEYVVLREVLAVMRSVTTRLHNSNITNILNS